MTMQLVNFKRFANEQFINTEYTKRNILPTESKRDRHTAKYMFLLLLI